MRLDRLVTLYGVQRLKQSLGQKGFFVPILMYHSVGEEANYRKHAYYRTAVSPRRFFAQMEYLHQNGYETCTPAQALSLVTSPVTPARKSVVITFDDGYLDFALQAFPVLNRFGFTATVYLPTSYIGESATEFKGQDCLTWPTVRELQKCGISFGSHTVTHPQLRTLARKAIERELVDSKKAIEDKTGCTVSSFAYPYAFPQVDAEFRNMLRALLQEAEYHDGVCTTIGRADAADDPFFLKRLPVNDGDDPALFSAKLDGAYDWVGWCQSTVKRVRSFRQIRRCPVLET